MGLRAFFDNPAGKMWKISKDDVCLRKISGVEGCGDGEAGKTGGPGGGDAGGAVFDGQAVLRWDSHFLSG